MVHGQIIPDTRNLVQFGQTYLNGDRVQMPDYLVNKDLPTETGNYGLADICQICAQSYEMCDMSVCGRINLETDVWDIPVYDDPEYNTRWYGELTQPIRTRERSRCYSCKTGTGQMRRVTGHFVTSKNFDPTQAYRLVCGHTSID